MTSNEMWVTGKSICSSDRLARSEGTFHRAPRCQLLLPIHVQAHLRIRHQAGEKRDHGHPLHELPLLDIEVHFQDIVSSPIVYHFQDKTIRTEKASLEFRESPSKCSAAHPKMQYVSLRGAVHQSPRMTSLLFSLQVRPNRLDFVGLEGYNTIARQQVRSGGKQLPCSWRERPALHAEVE